MSMQAFDPLGGIDNATRRTRVLKQGAEYRCRIEISRITDDHIPTQRLGSGLHDCNRLRMAITIDEERISLRLRHAPRHRHSFRGSGRLVEKRSVSDLQP